MSETRSLHRKLAKIMWEAERVPKRGKAPAAMGGFEFVQVGDAADYIRRALAENVLSMLPTKVTILGQSEHATKSGGAMTTVDIITEWTITDGESGESVTIESFGAGADGGDKYSGKAQTNAMKYALLMAFLLSTGDDPELSDSEERRAKPPRQVDGATGEIVRPVPHTAAVSRPTEQRVVTEHGTVRLEPTQSQDGKLRRGPDGVAHRGFRLITGTYPDGRPKGTLVELSGEPAEPDLVAGAEVSVVGRLEHRQFTRKDGAVQPFDVIVADALEQAAVTRSEDDEDWDRVAAIAFGEAK